MEVLAGIESGMARARQHCACETLAWFRISEPQVPRGYRYLLESPDTFLTKMRIVSSASEPRELMLEMESERRIMMAVAVRAAMVGDAGGDAGVAVGEVEITEVAPVADESGK